MPQVLKSWFDFEEKEESLDDSGRVREKGAGKLGRSRR